MARFNSVSSRRFLTRFRMTLMMEVVMAKSTYWTWMTLSQFMLLSRQDFLKIVELLLKCLFKVLRSELRFLMKSPRLRMTSGLRLLMMSSRLKFFMTRLRVFTMRTGLRVFTTDCESMTDCESSWRIASLHDGLRVFTTRTGLRVLMRSSGLRVLTMTSSGWVFSNTKG